jgi:hypothetical protein
MFARNVHQMIRISWILINLIKYFNKENDFLIIENIYDIFYN